MATDGLTDASGNVAVAPKCGWCGWTCMSMDAAKDHALDCDKSPIVARLRRLVEAAKAAMPQVVGPNADVLIHDLEDAITFAESPIH